MKKRLQKLRRRPQTSSEVSRRVTNDNIAHHREEVLKGARKFIYPLRRSKRRLVVLSFSIFIVALVGFFVYCTLALYKFKQSSDFLYNVTRVIPFPVARIGSDFISYENYLFEVRHYTHYYQKQQDIDFASEAGQEQLVDFKRQAVQKVINDAYVKRIAKEKGISVSNQELEDTITATRNQNRLGSNEQEFEAVLKDFWGWSQNDFRRSLRQQLLTQKVIAALDTETSAKANDALAKLKAGKDFAELAREVSEDLSTKDGGGEYPTLIDQRNRDIPPKTVQALFSLAPGQYSEVVNFGYGLEIVKTLEVKGDQIKGAHIQFNFKDITSYLNEYKEKNPSRGYVSF